MNENLGTSKILIKTVVRNLKALASKSGLFNRTYCLEAVVDDATRTLNSAIEFIDAGDAQFCPKSCAMQSQKLHIPTPEERIDASFQCIDYLTGKLFDRESDKVWIATWLSECLTEVKDALKEKGIKL